MLCKKKDHDLRCTKKDNDLCCAPRPVVKKKDRDLCFEKKTHSDIIFTTKMGVALHLETCKNVKSKEHEYGDATLSVIKEQKRKRIIEILTLFVNREKE